VSSMWGGRTNCQVEWKPRGVRSKKMLGDDRRGEEWPWANKSRGSDTIWMGKRVTIGVNRSYSNFSIFNFRLGKK
jgi:hypothetical protein